MDQDDEIKRLRAALAEAQQAMRKALADFDGDGVVYWQSIEALKAAELKAEWAL